MFKKFSKTYGFTLFTAALLSIISMLMLCVFLYPGYELNPWYIVFFGAVFFVICFVLFQYSLELFIFKKIKTMYDDISLLDATSFSQKSISTDMNTLTQEVGRFAENKKIEIETLKVRENYRKEFIGNVSHELKTPLFTVQGYILTLLDGAYKDKAVRKKYLKRANKGVERLLYIIKDLDMITQLEVGGLTLEKEKFNIIKLVKNVFDLLEMKANKKNISLVFDKQYKQGIKVYGDQERIQQVLSNLIVNSIKYGKNDGTTEVSVEHLVKDKVIIRVTDNGEGIENEHLTRLFERFYRVDKSGSRKEGGSGLGLAIVKHIVDAHQENIYVESQHGIGSEFSFTMQLSA
ncbi:MAG: Alkaline phosphatase synthesis sensor protein PhoR [Flavobacteriaceae bacterium]|nr:MAG: Alkaline phosphatase synthesis sensor protein PhoR [Flavobacteriaceae bacterium]